MSEKKTVLYVGNFSFPTGNAPGKRVYANGKIFQELGYNVIFIGTDRAVGMADKLIDTKNEFDGFTYYNLPYPRSNKDWIKYKKVFKTLIDLIAVDELFDDLVLVVYYGSPSLSLFNTKLIRFCNKRNIKVVSDCVDWLSTKSSNLIFNLVKWSDNTFQKAYANKKADGVIAISSYLNDYYVKHGCKTVVVPPLSPVNYSKLNPQVLSNEKKVITYAGLPFSIGKKISDCSVLKDRIDITIKLFYYAKKEQCNFVFNIYGFTKEDYLKSIPEQKEYVDKLGESIVFYGLKSNDEVIDAIINSDFTVLIRDIKRATTAGFPTKVTESISCGTPVITTDTSDIKKYIEQGKDGFVIEGFDEKSIQEMFIKILKLDLKQIVEMKEYCIKHSNEFYYKSFINQMDEFIKTIKVV